MPRPFVAYLRVYQPLSAFSAEFAERLSRAATEHPLERTAVGVRERELWLRSQVATPRRLLPGEFSDGRPNPNAPQDVLVLDPTEITDLDRGTDYEGAESLVCPLDLRPRAAAALVGFLSGASSPLATAAVDASSDLVRSRASSVMAQLPAGAVHSVSSTYTVPLPWFALVEQEERHVELFPRDDPRRTVRWTVTLESARTRVARALKVVTDSIGEDGPARILADTDRWLEHFDAASVVELDYGGLVQLLDDEQVNQDNSAEDVQRIVDALEREDSDEVTERYERLRDFWGDLAMYERAG